MTNEGSDEVKLSITKIIILELIVFILYMILKKEKKNSVVVKKSYLANVLKKIPFSHKLISNIKLKLYANTYEDEIYIERTATNIFVKSILVTIITILALIYFYGKDIYYLVTIILLSYSLYNLISKYYLGNNLTLLQQIIDFIRAIKHYYGISEMVDDSFLQAGRASEPNINIQAQKICEAMNGDEENLTKFNKSNPNKFIRILVQFSYLIKDIGDTKLYDGRSLYSTNLNYLIEEVKIEYAKQEKTNYILNYLQFFTLLPVLFMKPFELFAINNFPDTKSFYSSGLAYISKILLILICIVCTTLIGRMKAEEEEKIEKEQIKDSYWQHTLLRFSGISRIVKFFIPRKEKKIKNLKDLIEKSGENTLIEWIYLNRVISFILAFVLSVFLLLSYFSINKKNIYTDAYYKTSKDSISLLGNTSLLAQNDEKKIIEMDNYIISQYSNSKSEADKDSIRSSVISFMHFSTTEEIEYNKDLINIHTERLYKKIRDLKLQSIKPVHVVICTLVAFAASMIPIGLLYFQQFLRKQKIDNEIFLFQMLILLLKDYPKTTVKLILQWMERFSDVFSTPIKECLANYNAGSEEALTHLNSYIKYFPFNQIVENLMNAESNTDIKDAFDSLDSDRGFYRDDRKELINRRIENKNAAADIIGKIPMWTSILLFLAVPIAITAIEQAIPLLQQLQSLD